MEVIAKKSGSSAVFAVLNFVLAVVGVVLGVFGSDSADILKFTLLLPILLVPSGIYFLIKAMMPMDLIMLDGDNIILYDKRSFKVTDVKDVSYRRTPARGIQYSFGKIVLEMKSGEVVNVSVVAELESVGKRLSAIVYNKKQ